VILGKAQHQVMSSNGKSVKGHFFYYHIVKSQETGYQVGMKNLRKYVETHRQIVSPLLLLLLPKAKAAFSNLRGQKATTALLSTTEFG